MGTDAKNDHIYTSLLAACEVSKFSTVFELFISKAALDSSI